MRRPGRVFAIGGLAFAFLLLLLLVVSIAGCSAVPPAGDASGDSGGDSGVGDGGGVSGSGGGSGVDGGIDPATPRFVLLTADPRGRPLALARVILPAGSGCPAVAAGAGAPASGIPMSPRSAEARFAFPQVCEAVVPFDTPLAIRFADGGELSLPTVGRDPARILAMGDTGCEDCDGEPARPFADLAAVAAGDTWDVILHMGDYNYRGTPSKVTFPDGSQDWAYDAGDGTEESESCLQSDGSAFVSQNAPGNTPHDSWSAWELDFFTPAGELLWSAPWVFARGNHELCSRAGPGWLYFLGPSSDLPAVGGRQRRCPAADPPSRRQIENVQMIPPYLVDLGSLRIAVLDSANACDGFALPDMADFTGAYARQLGEIEAMVAGGTAPVWLMTHRPPWAVEDFEADKGTRCAPDSPYQCVNQTLEHAIENGLSGGAWPAPVELSLAGHMHHFQSLTFPAGQQPPQVVIGNGGVGLGLYGPDGSFEAAVDTGGASPARALGNALGKEAVAGGHTVPAFAFLEIDYRPGGAWSGRLMNTAEDVELAACSSGRAASGRICDLTATPVPDAAASK